MDGPIIQIVDESYVEELKEDRLPPMTICPFPARSNTLGVAMDMSNSLIGDGCNATAFDFNKCVASGHFHLEDLISRTYRLATRSPFNKSEIWSEASYNFFNGLCYTLQIPDLTPPNLWGHAVNFDFNLTTTLNYKLTMGGQIHDSFGYLTNIAMGNEFLRQKAVEFIPQPTKYNVVIVGKTKRMNINHPKSPCQTDEKWDVIKCIEEFSLKEIGCAYPWIRKADVSGYRNCSTLEDFKKMLLNHQLLYNTPSSNMAKVTGCLRPCHLHGYHVDLKQIVAGNGFNGSGIIYYFSTTNIQVTKESWLYDSNNLVGEVGGSLGLFLGASLLSIFELVPSVLSRALNTLSEGVKPNKRHPKSRIWKI
ncbi:uncharacterized protein LOC131890839 isoform X2 [Tigriopus californicus]|uniref:uncharacterized protein LOC131890839 isoform X2 n=1 Tax=Tigriopus californicus TaxID=6832 RepID=UPI0027DA1EBA|nr:uncharacterized protein LOC131890839 isoform X2 [Tigriopus californicus]